MTSAATSENSHSDTIVANRSEARFTAEDLATAYRIGYGRGRAVSKDTAYAVGWADAWQSATAKNSAHNCVARAVAAADTYAMLDTNR